MDEPLPNSAETDRLLQRVQAGDRCLTRQACFWLRLFNNWTGQML
jgi:hypothetical protein